MRPHNLPFVLLGVGLLWFGWFGFNAGSALEANGMASAAISRRAARQRLATSTRRVPDPKPPKRLDS